MIKLKDIIKEAFYYDVKADKDEFETSVASNTEAAKKKFETQMKEKVLNQKVKARASKGQPGQPEKDYIIDKVTDASVDWYYKQYVVVLRDEKGKEYFLKPGFRVEVLSASDQPQSSSTPKEPQPPAQKPDAAEKPSPVAPGTKPVSQPATGAPTGGSVPTEKPTKPVAEVSSVGGEKLEVSKKIGDCLWEFLSDSKKAEFQNNPDKAFLSYIKNIENPSEMGGDGGEVRWVLEIPIEDIVPDADVLDMQLAISDGLRTSSGYGREYTRANSDIQKIGRLYQIVVNYQTGVNN